MARKKLDVVEVSERLKALGRKEKWTPEEGAWVVKELAVYRRRGATLAAFTRGMGVTAQRIRNWRDGRNPGARRVRRANRKDQRRHAVKCNRWRSVNPYLGHVIDCGHHAWCWARSTLPQAASEGHGSSERAKRASGS